MSAPGTTAWRDHIVCPYCLEQDFEECEYPVGLDYDGNEAEHTCGYCGRTIIVTVSVSYSYSCAAKPDDSAEGGA